MDRYLHRKSEGETSLALITKSSTSTASLPIANTSHSTSCTSTWEAYANLDTLIKEEKKKSTSGWTKVNGEKAYKAFRNGKYVTKTGKEAMVLSLADKAASQRKRPKSTTSST